LTIVPLKRYPVPSSSTQLLKFLRDACPPVEDISAPMMFLPSEIVTASTPPGVVYSNEVTTSVADANESNNAPLERPQGQGNPQHKRRRLSLGSNSSTGEQPGGYEEETSQACTLSQIEPLRNSSQSEKRKRTRKNTQVNSDGSRRITESASQSSLGHPCPEASSFLDETPNFPEQHLQADDPSSSILTDRIVGLLGLPELQNSSSMWHGNAFHGDLCNSHSLENADIIQRGDVGYKRREKFDS